MERKYTRMKLKLLALVVGGTLAACLVGWFLLEFVVDGLLQDPFARFFIWIAQTLFGQSEDRALELYQTTGITMSEQLRRSRQTPSPYDAYLLVLDFRDRQALYERIGRRVDHMLEAGLLEEARTLLDTPHAPTAVQAIGYKELIPYFAGTLSLDEAVQNIKRGTRRYAKRQLTWFRRRADTIPVYADEYDDAEQMCDQAMQLLNEHYRW